jgi:hypothetical protein
MAALRILLAGKALGIAVTFAIGIGMIPRGEVGLIFANIAHPRRGGPAGHRPEHLFRGRRDGDRDDGDHAARAQMELRTILEAATSAPCERSLKSPACLHAD